MGINNLEESENLPIPAQVLSSICNNFCILLILSEKASARKPSLVLRWERSFWSPKAPVVFFQTALNTLLKLFPLHVNLPHWIRFLD